MSPQVLRVWWGNIETNRVCVCVPIVPDDTLVTITVTITTTNKKTVPKCSAPVLCPTPTSDDAEEDDDYGRRLNLVSASAFESAQNDCKYEIQRKKHTHTHTRESSYERNGV